MKRSQMIREIAEVIRDTYLLPETSIASAILNKIEALGMKPPEVDLYLALIDEEFTWEKEDV